MISSLPRVTLRISTLSAHLRNGSAAVTACADATLSFQASAIFLQNVAGAACGLSSTGRPVSSSVASKASVSPGRSPSFRAPKTHQIGQPRRQRHLIGEIADDLAETRPSVRRGQSGASSTSAPAALAAAASEARATVIAASDAFFEASAISCRIVAETPSP